MKKLCILEEIQGETMPNYFTLQEANNALTIIRPLMDEIQAIRQEILARQPEVWPVVERSAGNGGSQSNGQGIRTIGCPGPPGSGDRRAIQGYQSGLTGFLGAQRRTRSISVLEVWGRRYRFLA